MSHKEIKYIFTQQQKIAARKVESTSKTETRIDHFGERIFCSALKSWAAQNISWKGKYFLVGNSLMKCERSIFDRAERSSVVLTASKYGFSGSPSWGIDFPHPSLVNISKAGFKKIGQEGGTGLELRDPRLPSIFSSTQLIAVHSLKSHFSRWLEPMLSIGDWSLQPLWNWNCTSLSL